MSTLREQTTMTPMTPAQDIEVLLDALRDILAERLGEMMLSRDISASEAADALLVTLTPFLIGVRRRLEKVEQAVEIQTRRRLEKLEGEMNLLKRGTPYEGNCAPTNNPGRASQ